MAVTAYQNRANDAEKKQYRSNGFPLEDLEASFIDQMEVLGRLSVKSMNIARGAEQQEHSTSAGMT